VWLCSTLYLHPAAALSCWPRCSALLILVPFCSCAFNDACQYSCSMILPLAICAEHCQHAACVQRASDASRGGWVGFPVRSSRACTDLRQTSGNECIGMCYMVYHTTLTVMVATSCRLMALCIQLYCISDAGGAAPSAKCRGLPKQLTVSRCLCATGRIILGSSTLLVILCNSLLNVHGPAA
jgi:hypothetical protein